MCSITQRLIKNMWEMWFCFLSFWEREVSSVVASCNLLIALEFQMLNKLDN